jgi:hypothetical protein
MRTRNRKFAQHEHPAVTVTNEHDADQKTDVPDVPSRVPANGRNVPNDPDDVPNLNARQQWVMTQGEKGTEVRASIVVKQFGCSQKTAKRDLADLREERLLRFVGATRTGHYRLK